MTTREFNNRLISLEGCLKSYAKSLTRNEEDANDLIQETFLKVLENREKFDPSTNMKAWTYTIMKNTFINAYRRAKKNNECISNFEDIQTVKLHFAVHSETPDSVLYIQEIGRAIDNLGSEQRQSFQLYNKGYKYHEIANILHLSIGTVKSRIFFGRKKLMEDLKGYSN